MTTRPKSEATRFRLGLPGADDLVWPSHVTAPMAQMATIVSVRARAGIGGTTRPRRGAANRGSRLRATARVSPRAAPETFGPANSDVDLWSAGVLWIEPV